MAARQPVKITTAMLKGGGTRTTTAVFLAFELARRTSDDVLVVDVDTQNGTAFEWLDGLGDDRPANLDVAYWPVTSFARRVTAVNPTHLIVDTGNDAAGLEQALEVTDHALVTVKPSGAEVSRVQPTLDVIRNSSRAAQVQASILLTRVKARTVSLAQARQALAGIEDAQLLDTVVPDWELYAQAFGTVVSDAGAYAAVLDELMKEK